MLNFAGNENLHIGNVKCTNIMFNLLLSPKADLKIEDTHDLNIEYCDCCTGGREDRDSHFLSYFLKTFT